MTTPRTRSLVSLATTLTLALTLGGCASAPSSRALDASAPTDEAPLAIRFDNQGREYVRVYLVGARREWLLGRVEPGARATLRIPDEALADDSRAMRLAVLAGGRLAVQATGEARAATMMAEPVALILAQRWTFSQSLSGGQLTWLPLGRAELGRP
jgi:hypothetical protein